MVRLAPNFSGNRKSVPITYSAEQLKTLFRRFDSDGDGFLSKQELKAAFNHLGSSFPAWRAMRALRHADQNGDGRISIDDELEELVNYAFKRNYAV